MPDKNDDAIARLRVIGKQNSRPGVSAIRLQSIASTNPERKRQVKVEFLDTGTNHRMKRVKEQKFRITGSRTFSIPSLKNLEPVR